MRTFVYWVGWTVDDLNQTMKGNQKIVFFLQVAIIHIDSTDIWAASIVLIVLFYFYVAFGMQAAGRQRSINLYIYLKKIVQCNVDFNQKIVIVNPML